MVNKGSYSVSNKPKRHQNRVIALQIMANSDNCLILKL